MKRRTGSTASANKAVPAKDAIVLTQEVYPNGRVYWRVWVSNNIVCSVDSGDFGGFVARRGRKAHKTREEAARHGLRAEILRRSRDIGVLSTALESGTFVDAVDPVAGGSNV